MPTTGPTVRTRTSSGTNLEVEGTETLGTAARGAGATASYIKTTDGVQTSLLTSSTVDRLVMGVITVTTAFANGDGAQPTFKIGQTGSDAKFVATTVLTSAAAGATFAFAGTLNLGKDLFVTAATGTGTTETGAITVTVFAFPA